MNANCSIQSDSTPNITMKGQLNLAKLPINYHPVVSCLFDYWAMFCGLPTNKLCRSTTHVIRTRHHESVKDEFYRFERNGFPINIFALPVGCGVVHYAVEPAEIVVLGYSWHMIGPVSDDHDGGRIYFMNDWVWQQDNPTLASLKDFAKIRE